MNANLNKIDELNYELSIELVAEDYQGIEKKKLSEARRKADFKGFRKGNVPMSLVQKVYGGQCLADAVNQALGKALDSEIRGKELKILGEPLTSEKQPELEWVSGNSFTFVFDLGMTPNIDFEVVKEDAVPIYEIAVADEDKDKMVENLKKYHEAQNKEAEEKVEKSDEEFAAEAIERLTSQYANEAVWKSNKDIQDYFVNKANISLPEEFLKRWLLTANEGKITAEEIEKEFPNFVKDFKWQLVRGYLFNKYELKIEEEDIRKSAEDYLRYQYAMYGLADVPESILSEQVVKMLQDQKQVEHLYESVEESKILAKIKETITLNPTAITSTEFKAL